MKSLVNQQIFALNVARLIEHIYDHDFSCTLGEAYRTPEQAEIYAKQGKGIVNSQHCKRLAIDLNLFNASGEYLVLTETYERFGTYWESLSTLNRWGGRFKRSDGNHFEMKDKP